MNILKSYRLKLLLIAVICIGCANVVLMSQHGPNLSNSKAKTTINPMNFHIIYSIGCSSPENRKWQLMQALVLEHSWEKQKQHGRLTRLISGCDEDPEVQKYMSRTAFTDTSSLDRWDVAFVPATEKLPNGKVYVQANRPSGVLTYLNKLKNVQNVIFCLLDPDFVFLKPILPSVYEPILNGETVAIAQSYGMGTSFISSWGYTVCKSTLLGKAFDGISANCERLKHLGRHEKYNVGVPYIIEGSNLKRVLNAWIMTIPDTQKYYDGIESDMYAYAIAAASLSFTHQRKSDFMSTCMSSENNKYAPFPGNYFIHYCQRYMVPETRGEEYRINLGKELIHSKTIIDEIGSKLGHIYVFSKHFVKPVSNNRDFLACDTPLLVPPPKLSQEMLDIHPMFEKHNMVLEKLIPAFNDAILVYKKKFCNDSDITALKHQGLLLQEMHRHNGNRLNRVINLSNEPNK